MGLIPVDKKTVRLCHTGGAGTTAKPSGHQAVDLVGGYGCNTEFGRHRIDCMARDVEVDLAVSVETRANVPPVVLLSFITGQAVEERGDVVDG